MPEQTPHQPDAASAVRPLPTVPKVSVIIPTRNGSRTLRELLAALRIQSVAADEILVVDSQSTDDTVSVATQYGAVVFSVAAADFDHGGTRSFAAGKASGEVLVFFTQDALPTNRQVLANLIKPLLGQPAVAIAYGRQLPAFDADAIAAHLRLFNYPQTPAVRSFGDRHQLGLATIFTSNSCAAYRRDALADIDFFPGNLIFGEDTWVAGQLLQRDWRIAYAADATVYHSHNYRREEEFRRYFDIGVLHAGEPWLLQTYGGVSGRGASYLRSGLAYLRKRRSYSAIGEFMVRVALKWIGYQLGRQHRLLPVNLARNLSMNKRWWDRRGRS